MYAVCRYSLSHSQTLGRGVREKEEQEGSGGMGEEEERKVVGWRDERGGGYWMGERASG